MPNYTLNYNLRKPTGSEQFNLMTDMNGNLDIIDSQLFTNSQMLTSINANSINTTGTGNIVDFKVGGTAKAYISKDGILYTGLYPVIYNYGGVPYIQSGLDAGKPAASSGNSGSLYVATDSKLIYQSTGSTWELRGGLSNTVLDIGGTPCLQSGLDASKPTAAPGNSGYVYFASDTKLIYQSNGTTWETRGGSDATLTIAKGGTGATTAPQALINFGLTATAAELNYVDGVTSAIQTQLNNKLSSQGSTVAGTRGIFNGTYTATVASRYNSSALEIRENGLVGNAQTDIGYAPTIGFHWSGKIGATIAMDSTGMFNFIIQAGTGYSPIQCGSLFVNGSTKAAGYFYTGTTAATNTNRLNFDGYFYATRVYNAVFNDYAEYFEKDKSEEFEPGDVVCRSKDTDTYCKSSSPYDKNVVGVYSDSYGHILGGNGDGNDDENFIPIGLSGRVMVKAVGYIEKGDLLVASHRPGVAMSYNRNYIPGTIIGKALEDYNSCDIGKIRMLIMNC